MGLAAGAREPNGSWRRDPPYLLGQLLTTVTPTVTAGRGGHLRVELDGDFVGCLNLGGLFKQTHRSAGFPRRRPSRTRRTTALLLLSAPDPAASPGRRHRRRHPQRSSSAPFCKSTSASSLAESLFHAVSPLSEVGGVSTFFNQLVSRPDHFRLPKDPFYNQSSQQVGPCVVNLMRLFQ